jgi:DNA-directed RNA polymerase specialized sigma24 family protein
MKAKEYLGKIAGLNDHIDELIAERQNVIERAMGLKSPALGDKVQAGYSGDSLESAIGKLTEIEAQIDSEIDVYYKKRKRIRDMISELPDPRYRQVLYMRYLEFKRLEDIACTMRKRNGGCYSYNHIQRLHGYALAAFARKYSSEIF